MRKLVNPAEWLRLARGAVDMGKLRQGLTKIAAAPSPLDATAAPLIHAIHGWGEDAAIIVAQGDATGVAFRAAVALLLLVRRVVAGPEAAQVVRREDGAQRGAAAAAAARRGRAGHDGRCRRSRRARSSGEACARAAAAQRRGSARGARAYASKNQSRP